MRRFFTLYMREVTSYFITPVGYIVMAVFLCVLGWLFWLLVSFLNKPGQGALPEGVFGIMFGNNFIYWMVLAATTSALTMRLFAEERRSGTIELLMTAPVSDLQVVLSKYFAALSFLLLMWLPTTIYVLILGRFAYVDYGVVFAGYIGTILLCALLIALGCFISSFTKSQLIAFLIAFIAMMMLFSLSFMQSITTPFWREIYKYCSILEQFQEYPKGVLDSRSIIYFLSVTVFLIFCTIKSVESHKWR